MPDVRPIPSFYNDLEETLAEAWRLLSRGVVDRHSAFHTPTIGTLGLDGSPKLRTVVLRACEPALKQLRFHTDARAGKIAELSQNPRIALHGYDAGSKVQIRIEGRARIHSDDEIADASWAKSLAMSRACYSIMPGPGTVLKLPDAYEMPSGADDASKGRADFRVVSIAAASLEWLYLARQGHRRARFDLLTGTSTWLAP